jgi:GNAT superfamily N-acetyltransferase
MVLAEFRRQKVFLQLARQTYSRLDAAGIRLAYVFPAASVRTPFVGQFGYAQAGSVPRFVKVVRTEALGRALGHPGPKAWLDQLAWAGASARRAAAGAVPAEPGLRVSAARAFDARFDELWQRCAAAFSIATVRDGAYLNWRYAQNPLRDYLILIAERGEQLLGCAVLLIEPEQHVTYIVELLLAPQAEAAGQALLAEAAARARQAGCAQVQCWMLRQYRAYVQVLERSGFVYWPSGLLPGWLGYATPFIARVAPGADAGPEAATLDNWFLSMGDHDYY